MTVGLALISLHDDSITTELYPDAGTGTDPDPAPKTFNN